MFLGPSHFNRRNPLLPIQKGDSPSDPRSKAVSQRSAWQQQLPATKTHRADHGQRVKKHGGSPPKNGVPIATIATNDLDYAIGTPIVGNAPGFEEGFLHWSRRCKIMTCVIAWPYMSGFLACTVRVMDNRTKSKSDQEWTCYTPKRKPLVKSQNHRTWLSKHPSSRIIWSWEDMLKKFWGATMWHTWNDSGVPWRFSQSWGFSSSG